MIHTDGKQTIANAPTRKSHADKFVADVERERLARLQDAVEAEAFFTRPTASERIRQARELREEALDAAGQYDDYLLHYDREFDDREPLSFEDWLRIHGPNRGPQDNGQQWNDGYCACGVAICDSPAGDKCWDCFNADPSE